MSKKTLALVFTFIFALSALLAGCGSKPAAEKPLKVGVTAGPHAEVMEVVKKVAEKEGLKIQIVEFNDYIQPNVALNQGDIDVNSFQHKPYLDHIVKDRNYDIVSVANTIIFPMGIYSKKIQKIDQLQDGATVGMPNDPTNGARALLILEKQGLLKLKPGVGANASVADIVENPKNLKLKELDAALIPRSLEDLDLAAVNTNYAMTAGFVPKKDALLLEDSNSPYANILAARSKDKDDPRIQKLIKAYHSQEVKDFVQEHFKDSVVTCW